MNRNIQQALLAVNELLSITRCSYHITLGEMINFLETVKNKNMPVITDRNEYLNKLDSYRGYYEDLSFSPSGSVRVVHEVLAECRKALGERYEGYKGGEFDMTEKTPLWVANYGDLGRAIVGIQVDDTKLTIITKDIF